MSIYAGRSTVLNGNNLSTTHRSIWERTRTRDGLRDTPERRAAAAMEFLMQGYELDLDQVINDALFPSDSDEMVIVKNIELYSMCEHHLLPFIGKCHVAYLPKGRVIGLSKIARLVDMYARRLQIQENLTNEIANCDNKQNRRRRRGRNHRSSTYVHDDAGCRKAELYYDHFLYARRIP